MRQHLKFFMIAEIAIFLFIALFSQYASAAPDTCGDDMVEVGTEDPAYTEATGRGADHITATGYAIAINLGHKKTEALQLEKQYYDMFVEAWSEKQDGDFCTSFAVAIVFENKSKDYAKKYATGYSKAAALPKLPETLKNAKSKNEVMRQLFAQYFAETFDHKSPLMQKYEAEGRADDYAYYFTYAWAYRGVDKRFAHLWAAQMMQGKSWGFAEAYAHGISKLGFSETTAKKYAGATMRMFQRKTDLAVADIYAHAVVMGYAEIDALVYTRMYKDIFSHVWIDRLTFNATDATKFANEKASRLLDFLFGHLLRNNACDTEIFRSNKRSEKYWEVFKDGLKQGLDLSAAEAFADRYADTFVFTPETTDDEDSVENTKETSSGNHPSALTMTMNEAKLDGKSDQFAGAYATARVNGMEKEEAKIYAGQIELGKGDTYAKAFASRKMKGHTERYASDFARAITKGNTEEHAEVFATLIEGGKSEQYAHAFATARVDEGRDSFWANHFATAMENGSSKRVAAVLAAQKVKTLRDS